MKRNLLALAIATLGTQAAAGTVTIDGADIVIKTKGGFEVKTSDGEYSFKLGGRVQLDYNSYDGVTNAKTGVISAADAGNTGSDLFFRRSRLSIKGHAGDWKYGLSYNLDKSGDDSIDSLKVGYTGFGKQLNITAGKQKEDFGLEDTGGSKWITAIERSMPSNAFDTGNNIGIKVHGASDLFTYSLGSYKIDTDSNRDLETSVTGRFVIRPIYSKDAVLHLGAGFTQRDSDTAFDDFDTRVGVRGGDDGDATKFSPQFNSGDGDEMTVYNLEAAYSTGPVHLMAEYFDGEIEAPDTVAGSDDLNVDGYYFQAGWIVTGESRSYKKSSGSFDKVKPSGKNGAWEVFARYDSMDAESGTNIGLVGGEGAETATVGVNWYASSNVKVALNYVKAETDKKIQGEDDGDALVGRLQYTF